MQAIDVVMLTKNSEYMLKRSLSSIYENVPVRNLIVVDGFSTDRTLKILDQFNNQYGNVKLLSSSGSRAKAREKGIIHVGTEWFLFADSDIVLSKNWFLNAQKSIQKDVGAIWGINIDVVPKLFNKRYLRLQTLVAKECFELRGGTHDTLIRRDLVQDIKIPEKLHTYEDAYIMNWIKDKGYKTLVGDGIFCLHFKPSENWNIRNAISGAILELKCGLIYSRNFVYMMYYPFFAGHWIIQMTFQNVKSLFS